MKDEEIDSFMASNYNTSPECRLFLPVLYSPTFLFPFYFCKLGLLPLYYSVHTPSM